MAQRLTRPEAARLLLHDRAQRVLRPYLHAELGVADAARAAGLPANVTAYWVKKLLRLGLLEGRTLGGSRRYRATSPAFFAPFAALGARTVEAIYAELQTPFTEAFAGGVSALIADPQADWGICLSAVQDELVLTVVDDTRNITLNSRQPGAPATVNLWGNVNLNFEDAKALQNDLIAVYQRYLGRQGGQRYLVRLGMVPLPPETPD